MRCCHFSRIFGVRFKNLSMPISKITQIWTLIVKYNFCFMVMRHNMDGVLVENMFDLPYVKLNQAGPELNAFMALVCTEVKKILPS
ncbi:uncharacterized protein LOC119185834 isoform X3 [Rhipicephalus microplus]|uniref:uncharacterized protein LOC119185834 isoform X3 n=1 Tax=Rhipicephalus microplus TaxID=6941 RepID=UPI003F6D32AF